MFNALCLLYNVYHRLDHSLNESLKLFIEARNIGVSATICELALLMAHCRTDQFS